MKGLCRLQLNSGTHLVNEAGIDSPRMIYVILEIEDRFKLTLEDEESPEPANVGIWWSWCRLVLPKPPHRFSKRNDRYASAGCTSESGLCRDSPLSRDRSLRSRVDRQTVEVLRKCASDKWVRLVRRLFAQPNELVREVTEQQAGGRRFESRLVLEKQSRVAQLKRSRQKV